MAVDTEKATDGSGVTGLQTATLRTRPPLASFALAVGGVTAAICICGVVFTPFVLRYFHYSDFGTFYRAAATGRLYGPDPYLPVIGPVTLTNLNPPHFHVLFRPLTLLPMPYAYLVWLALSGCAFGIGLWRTAARIPPAWPWWMWFVLLAWNPLYSLVYTGQITALVFVPLLLAWWADRDGHETTAGIWMGLALSLKPHLVLVLAWWVFRGRWRSLGLAAVAVAAVTALGVAVYGWDAYGAWAAHLQEASWPWASMNSSLWALPSRLWHETPYYPHLAERPQLVAAVTALVVAPAALATLWCLWRERNVDLAWALALVATSVLMPLGWAYYAWWWVPMVMGLRLPRATWAAVAVLWLVPTALLTAWTRDSVLLMVTIQGAPVYAMATLWAALLRISLKEGSAGGRLLPVTPTSS